MGGGKWVVVQDKSMVYEQEDVVDALAMCTMCTHENTWLRKVSWDPLQWTWRDPYAGQGSKPIPFFQFTTRLGRHILATQTA